MNRVWAAKIRKIIEEIADFTTSVGDDPSVPITAEEYSFLQDEVSHWKTTLLPILDTTDMTYQWLPSYLRDSPLGEDLADSISCLEGALRAFASLCDSAQPEDVIACLEDAVENLEEAVR
jgi:hypothetical protein